MNARNRFEKYIKLFIYMVVIVLINLAGITLFFRFDLTENKIYSISKISKEVVSTLSEPLTINLFFTENLPAPHNNTERYLHDLLEEYSIYANRHFNYRFYNVSSDMDDISEEAGRNRELANSYGINPVQIQLIEKDEVKFKKAYMGLVLIHGDIIERIPTITSTDGLEYKLTTAIQKLNNKISALLSLSDNIRVKLFLSSSLQTVAPFMGIPELSGFPEKLKDIVAKLNNRNYGKLEFTYIDPSKDGNHESIPKEYNIMTLKWPALSNGKIPAGDGVIGLVLKYGKKIIEIPLLNVLRIPIIGTRYNLIDIGRMEEIINENIESLVDINESIGYLADHGTLKLGGHSPTDPLQRGEQDSLKNLSTLISQSYTVKEVNLKEEGVSDGFKSLIIARPAEKFTEYELYQIDQALMRGKNLALFLDVFKESTPPNRQSFNQGPEYIPLDTGLEKLLAHYGMRIKRSYVMDENCYKQRVPGQFGGGERTIYFAPIIKNKNINNDLGYMKNIKGLVVIKISPLDPDDKRIAENGIEAVKLFSSSEKSWEMTKRINLNPMFIHPPPSNDDKESFPLAYMLEGEFPSYFAGKPVPEKEDTDSGKDKEKENKKNENKKNAEVKKSDIDLSKIEGTGGILTKGRPGRIFLIASSEILKDNILDPEGKSPNAMFIANIIDALNNRDEIAVMRSKKQRFNPLDETSGLTKTSIKTFNIAGLPAIVVIFGLFVWLRRRSRKKQIKMMFQKF